MKEALYWSKQHGNAVRCNLCPNFCLIKEGCFGSCRSRKNVSGVLVAVNYSRTVSLQMDPIEKKPLYHYYPGSQILSLGANSCNLHCDFCQNYEISQADCPTQVLAPEELLDILLRKGLQQVAFTYTEPFTWFEYILDCGKLLTENGIRLVLVTNGYVNQEPLKEILPYIDAMNIDLKSSRPEFYQKTCQGKLEPVLETIRTAAKHCHVELTNLLIPGLNDSADEISELVDFVAEVKPALPLHFSRYHPSWKCAQPPTPESTLFKAYEIASAKLDYVYLGNLASGEYSDTHCPACRALLISRSGFGTDRNNLVGNDCPACEKIIYGRL
jgi:pyruvate formate lyase activating enzyme